MLIISPNLSRNGRPFALIENVVTLSDFRKKGYGNMIMDHAITLARKSNCYKIMLLTGSKNPNTHSFYKWFGFSWNDKKGYVLKI